MSRPPNTERVRSLAVAPAKTQDTLRKAIDALAIVPTKQRIFPLARKLYNVLLFLAQKQGWERDVYRASLPEIVSKARFTSKDTEIIKNHLRQMNSTPVEWQSPSSGESSRWDISNLLAHAAVISHGNGNAAEIEWSFAPNIKRELLDPQRFAQVSLYFQSALRTYASLALFEICTRYLDNPGNLTARNAWGWWRPVLTGIPDQELEAYREYKYFKRDVLNPAIAEINKVTDMDVELVEHRIGRRMDELQFRVSRKQQPALPLAHQPEFDLSLIGEAIRLGVGQMAAETLLTRYGLAAFRAALKELGERLQQRRGQAVEQPERWLTAVLRNGKLASNQPVVAKSSATTAKPHRREDLEKQYREARRADARALFAEMSEQARAELLKAFETEAIDTGPQLLRRAYSKSALATPLVAAAFGDWFAARTWGPTWGAPTAEDLLAMIAQ